MENNYSFSNVAIDEECTFKENGKILDVIKVTFVTKARSQDSGMIRLKVRIDDNEFIETMYHIIGVINSENHNPVIIVQKH